VVFNGDVHGSCWCSLARRMASIEGKIVGTRQADIMLVVECEVSDCPVRKTRGCLIGARCCRKSLNREFEAIPGYSFVGGNSCSACA